LRAKDGEKTAATGEGPDPAEFDPDFVIGEDDEQPSRAGTPRPKEKAEAGDGPSDEVKEKTEEEKGPAAPAQPPDVVLRLRRLEKLEPKYTGWLLSNVLGPV
jgi:hypothetical protein